MRIFLLLAAIAHTSMHAWAQQGQLDVVGTHPAGTGSVRYFDPAASLGPQKYETLTYAEVEGSPFLDPRWSKGSLEVSTGKPIPFGQMKYDAYASEVHYIDAQGQELAVGIPQAHRFVLMSPNDPAVVSGKFEAMMDMFNEDKRTYYRVLNEGKYRLVVLHRCTIKKGNFDPLLGKKELHFITRTWYGIAEFEYIHPIFILDKDRVDKELKFTSDQQKWLKDHHNKLKSEAEVIDFLLYLNGTNK